MVKYEGRGYWDLEKLHYAKFALVGSDPTYAHSPTYALCDMYVKLYIVAFLLSFAMICKPQDLLKSYLCHHAYNRVRHNG